MVQQECDGEYVLPFQGKGILFIRQADTDFLRFHSNVIRSFRNNSIANTKFYLFLSSTAFIGYLAARWTLLCLRGKI